MGFRALGSLFVGFRVWGSGLHSNDDAARNRFPYTPRDARGRPVLPRHIPQQNPNSRIGVLASSSHLLLAQVSLQALGFRV